MRTKFTLLKSKINQGCRAAYCHDQATRDIFKIHLKFPFLPAHKSETLKYKPNVCTQKKL